MKMFDSGYLLWCCGLYQQTAPLGRGISLNYCSLGNPEAQAVTAGAGVDLVGWLVGWMVWFLDSIALFFLNGIRTQSARQLQFNQKPQLFPLRSLTDLEKRAREREKWLTQAITLRRRVDRCKR
jgi:hypothetical protein